MEMNIQNIKIELIQWLASLNDKETIEKISEIKTNSDWWESVSDEEKKSIKKGIIDAEKGKLQLNEKAKEIYGKWL